MFRLILAILVGKLIYFLTRLFGIGGGSAAPGLYALKICPNLIEQLSSQIPQNIMITGTNGKTTTARLLNQLLLSQSLNVIRNSTGSNLERGIASALINKVNFFGEIERVDLGIWETDEAAFNKVVFKIKPQIMVFLNAFRDQLDRYGEVDAVTNNWREAINKINWQPKILANSGDINTVWITDYPGKNFYSFRVKNHFVVDEENISFNEPKSDKSFNKNFKADFSAQIIKNKGLLGTDLELKFPKGELKFSFNLPGIYHVYDLLAASGIYYLLDLPIEVIPETLKNYRPAFGRIEEIELGGGPAYICLIKNPAGTNSVLETIAPEIKPVDHLLLILNDNFADGRDVSWIWDCQFEALDTTKSAKIVVSGTRAEDMALRLKYAGLNSQKMVVEDDLEQALEQAQTDLEGRLFILPTYTALLKLQKILSASGIKPDYWREE